LLIILSGPSGVGKDVLLNELKRFSPMLDFVTTVTTRARRPNEEDGVHYHFVSRDEFRGMKEKGELLEWAKVYGNWYGVPAIPIRRALARGKDTIVKVDIQGVAAIKKCIPEAISIMLVPESIEDLIRRLQQRRTENTFDLELRIRTAQAELEQIKLFDYAVVNRQGGVAFAVSEIKAIITAEKCLVHP
jgi:guanylate kinase